MVAMRVMVVAGGRARAMIMRVSMVAKTVPRGRMKHKKRKWSPMIIHIAEVMVKILWTEMAANSPHLVTPNVMLPNRLSDFSNTCPVCVDTEGNAPCQHIGYGTKF